MQQKRNQQAEIRLGSHGEDYGSWMSNPVFYIIGGITALAVVLAILSFSVFHITALGVLFSVVTAVLAALLSFCPKFAALVSAMPTGTIGGVSLILYGMISAIGVRNLVENRVDLAKSRNVIVVSLIISLALGITFSAAGAITFHVGEFTLNFSGLAVAAIVGIVVNAILPGKDYNFQNDYEYGKTTEDHGQML